MLRKHKRKILLVFSTLVVIYSEITILYDLLTRHDSCAGVRSAPSYTSPHPLVAILLGLFGILVLSLNALMWARPPKNHKVAAAVGLIFITILLLMTIFIAGFGNNLCFPD